MRRHIRAWHVTVVLVLELTCVSISDIIAKLWKDWFFDVEGMGSGGDGIGDGWAGGRWVMTDERWRMGGKTPDARGPRQTYRGRPPRQGPFDHARGKGACKKGELRNEPNSSQAGVEK
jgi:hypothetical protein